MIDGVADLLSEVNNLDEANAVAQKIMEWTYIYKCHAITVIHTNYGTDKPTGHLGSALMKKAETQIHLKPDEEDNGVVQVVCQRSRGVSFNAFAFRVNEFGLPLIIEDSDISDIEFKIEEVIG